MCYRQSRAATLGRARGPERASSDGRERVGTRDVEASRRRRGPHSSRMVVDELRFPDATTLPRIETEYG